VKRLALFLALLAGWAVLERERVLHAVRTVADTPAVQSLSGAVAGIADRMR
jgi:hypothetical protein